jgi:hypothetical protein
MPRRKLNPVRKIRLSLVQPSADANVSVISAEDTMKKGDEGYTQSRRMATVGHQGLKDPLVAIGKAITDALNPTTAVKPCKTLATMTPEERAKMEALYGPIGTRPLLDSNCNCMRHGRRPRPRAVKSLTCPSCGKVLTSCDDCLRRRTLESRLEAHIELARCGKV